MESRIGNPWRCLLSVSLIRPASSTVWRLVTAIELLTRRCEIVGAQRAGVAYGDAGDLLLDVELDVATGPRTAALQAAERSIHRAPDLTWN
ncbi:hypothetical protein ACKWRH_31145 [Bradyrhizobium sp. Pa8]|uniref:hypothetical protein n=1 Tax=Bradyrhizobium sp. Pa8 TaxID=3386552 RepID=UPI00403F676C